MKCYYCEISSIMKAFLFSLFTVFCTVRGTPLVGCSFETNTDYLGNNIRNITNSPDTQACCDACKTEVGCSVWSYDHVDSICYLKTSSASNTTKNQVTSGSLKDDHGILLECDIHCICTVYNNLTQDKGNTLRVNYGRCIADSERYTFQHDLQTWDVLNPVECCDNCWATHGCISWIFAKAGSVFKCWAKSAYIGQHSTATSILHGNLTLVPDPRNPADADEAVCTGGPDFGVCKYTFH